MRIHFYPTAEYAAKIARKRRINMAKKKPAPAGPAGQPKVKGALKTIFKRRAGELSVGADDLKGLGMKDIEEAKGRAPSPAPMVEVKTFEGVDAKAGRQPGLFRGPSRLLEALETAKKSAEIDIAGLKEKIAKAGEKVAGWKETIEAIEGRLALYKAAIDETEAAEKKEKK